MAEKFADKISIETQRLLEIVPGFDPGAGNVSSSCKKHSKIFQRELKKLSLWALKSKYKKIIKSKFKF